MNSFSWNYDRAEIAADGIIHVVGVILGVGGAIAMIATTLRIANVSSAIAASVYALTLITTLSMSAVYNIWPVGARKWRLRKYDHAAIYMLIAGTYTPFALQLGAKGAWLLVWIWAVAAVGMLLKVAFPGRYDRIAILLYLGLGWSGVAMFDTLLESLSPAVIRLLLIGGIVYSGGVIFHLWQSLRFQNAIWHAFVLAGAIFHYCAVLTSVVSSVGV